MPDKNTIEGEDNALAPVRASVPQESSGASPLNAAGPQATQAGRRVLTRITESHQGPLPSARYFEAVERVLAGSTDRIIGMTERALGEQAKDAATSRLLSVLGLVFAFIFLMSVLAIGGSLLFLGKEVQGLTTLFLAVAGIVGLLVTPKLINSRTDEQYEDDDDDDPT